MSTVWNGCEWLFHTSALSANLNTHTVLQLQQHRQVELEEEAGGERAAVGLHASRHARG